MLYMLRNRSSSLLTTKTKGSQVSDAYAVEQAYRWRFILDRVSTKRLLLLEVQLIEYDVIFLYIMNSRMFTRVQFNHIPAIFRRSLLSSQKELLCGIEFQLKSDRNSKIEQPLILFLLVVRLVRHFNPEHICIVTTKLIKFSCCSCFKFNRV